MAYLVRPKNRRPVELSGSQIEDLFNSLVSTGQKAVAGKGAEAVDKILSSSEFARVLDAVKKEAGDAVADKTKQNAFTLVSLAVAGGTVGGVIFGRSALGIGVAAAITAWAGNRLSKAVADPPKKVVKK